MQQPHSSSYQYGASRNPNMKPLPQFNTMEPNLNVDNANVSHYGTSENSQIMPSQYSSGHATSYTSNPTSNDRYMSSFSNTPGSSTLSSAPLNGSYQQNSTFTSVTSSFNYIQGGGNTSVEETAGSNIVQPPIGTLSNETQNQFIPPSNNMTKHLPMNENIKPPAPLATNLLDLSRDQPPLTNGSQPSFPTQAAVQTPGTPKKTFPPSAFQQPLSPGNSVQQPLPSGNSTFSLTRSTNVQPSIASAAFQQQSISTSSYQPFTTSIYEQQSMSIPNYQQQNLFSPNNPLQPPSSGNQEPPDSTVYSAQQSVASTIRQPIPIASNSFQPPTAGSSNFPSSGNISQQPLASRPPTAPTSYPQQSIASNILSPPVSTNSFQAPSSNMPPPAPQLQPLQKQRPAYPQQGRMPPTAYSQASKTPLSNGIPPLSNTYQQPNANIPPLSNSQYNPSPIQPSNVYNNQVPPSYNGLPPARQPGYPSNNLMTQPPPTGYPQNLDSQFSNLSVNQSMNRMWGYEPHDLLNTRDILPSDKVEPPPIRLPQNLPDTMNCSRDLFRCTLTKIPESKSLLDKSRLPLGLLIHPFKDINNLKVIKNMIVRCRQCRTYINPFVQFLDSKQWKCNICFRTNEIHEQFLYDRNTEMFGDPYRRPEIQSATVEYLATSDYTVRDPPQPAMYLFLLDVSQIAAQSGYLYTVCEVLLKQLKSMPGDLRTSVGIITYDSAVHFYSLAEGQTQPSQMILTDIEDIFLPSPENILVNLKECYDMIVDLLKQLPGKFKDSLDSGSALGPALQAAFKLLQPTGGRITIFQTCLPNRGPGALEARENPNQRSNDEPPHMNPATDFYKKIALECTSFYIAVDLFIVNSQYVDLATLSGVSKFSSGCIHHIPLYNGKNQSHVTQLERIFSRYLTRKIGFESVMRIRCTKGLSIHTFHGNFFVRSTDLLALPNVNPDAGYGIQISIDESLTHIQYACFQVAVLYTSSKGDRRIRVHTLCLPVCSNVNDILVGADQQCIAGLLAKMAVDRSLQHSLADAREAFLNVVCDVLSTYKITQSGHQAGSLLAPSSLKLLPLYILALLKHPAFRIGQSTRLDDRVFAMTEMKCLPLNSLMLSIYPELYPIHTLESDPTFEWNELDVPIPRIVQLSAERLSVTGTYLLNLPDIIIILVRHGTPPAICSGMFGFQSVAQMPETLYELPQLETQLSLRLHSLISYLNDDKAYVSPVKVMKDSSPDRMEFYDKLIEDKNAGGMSYYEFLQRIREQVKNY